MFTAVHFVLLLTIDLAIILLPDGNLRAASAFVLLWVLPGYAWGRALGGRWLVGFGLGTGINALLTLLYHYIPGPISFVVSLILFTLAVLLPLYASRLTKGAKLSVSWIMIPILIVSALLRLPNLGYSELQGDEGIIMVRAAAAIAGDDAELLLHQKGPFEILVPMAMWRLSDTINEFWARLPFAWVGILGIAAIYQLGRRWFGPAGGLTAGLLLAINGFHVAFGRIIQYQDIVVWVGLLALLVLDDYREHGRILDLLLGAAFLALGALAHYDAVLVAPAAVVLAFRWTPGELWRLDRRVAVRHYVLALGIGAVVLAMFYVPFVANPNFGKTSGYIATGRVGGGLHFNVDKLWVMSTVYNATYYVVLLLMLALASLSFVRSFKMLFYAWAVFAIPLFFYLVVVLDPRTHIYTFYAGAALLAGATLAGLWRRLASSNWRWAAAAVGVGAYVLCAGYAWIVFVEHTPEYQRTWPDNKLELYWTTYVDIPVHGRFGFPHRAGWHAVSAMMADGTIAGTYASNEEQEITDFYTRQASRTHCSKPDVYIVAENVQDEVRIDWVELERDYRLAGVVTVQGEPRIRWYTRDASQVWTVDQAEHTQWWTPDQVAPPTTGGTVGIRHVFNDEIELLGYDLRKKDSHPGGWIEVTLYWRPMVPLGRNHQVFVHLYDGQKLWAQHDGAPECAIMPTTRWEPGRIIPDPHLVVLPEDMPVGPMPLYVGLYDLLTKDRLAVPGVPNNMVPLTEIDVR